MEIVIAIILVTAIGVLCSVMLVLASHFMSIPVDEKEKKVRECLPGVNCGACGYTGCDGYAKALADGSTAKVNLCVPGSDKVAKDIANALGVEAEDVVEKVAFVHCIGDCTKRDTKEVYEGISSCAAAKMAYGGEASCVYGCIGLGDCAVVCPTDAICIENGIAHIDPRKCIGCGLCAKACPNGLITLFEDYEKMAIACSNKEKGAEARKKCEHACIKCHLCEKKCPVGAISFVDGLPVIDLEKCTDCGTCAKVCPQKCIIKTDFVGKHNIDEA